MAQHAPNSAQQAAEKAVTDDAAGVEVEMRLEFLDWRGLWVLFGEPGRQAKHQPAD